MSDDQGLATERTVLAWNRTALASVVLAGAIVRVAVKAFAWRGAVLVGGVLVVAGVAGGLACVVRASRLRSSRLAAGPLPPRVALVVVVGAVVVGLAAFGIAVVQEGLFVV